MRTRTLTLTPTLTLTLTLGEEAEAFEKVSAVVLALKGLIAASLMSSLMAGSGMYRPAMASSRSFLHSSLCARFSAEW
jgi:hypothetical protein